MTPYRTLIYLVKRQRKFKKLIFPFSFFILEFALITLISLNILGFNIFNMKDRFVTEPMVFVRMIHPPELISSYSSNIEMIPFFSMNESISPAITFLNFVSIIVALIGIVIAILWMNRFFKLNSLNIEWWIWPAGCISAHTQFFMILI